MQLKRKPKRTVRVEAVRKIAMVAGNERLIKAIVDDGDVYEWAAIGWLRVRPATEADKRKYPRVVR